MQLRKFYATSLPAAMRDIRRALGPEAVIVSTRSLSGDAGVFQSPERAKVEVTAGLEPPRSAQGLRPAGGNGVVRAASQEPQVRGGVRNAKGLSRAKRSWGPALPWA